MTSPSPGHTSTSPPWASSWWVPSGELHTSQSETSHASSRCPVKCRHFRQIQGMYFFKNVQNVFQSETSHTSFQCPGRIYQKLGSIMIQHEQVIFNPSRINAFCQLVSSIINWVRKNLSYPKLSILSPNWTILTSCLIIFIGLVNESSSVWTLLTYSN